jgi:hypothetical protein
LPFVEFREGGEDTFEALEAAGFFEEQGGAILETGKSGGGIGAAGEHDFGGSGKVVVESAEQLDAIDIRHIDIEHDEVDGLGREQGEGLVGTRGSEDAPELTAELREGSGNGFQESRIVVDKQDGDVGRGIIHRLSSW